MFLVKLHSNEEIAPKNLNSFILTNLKKKNIKLKQKDKSYFTFIKELNLYQVFIFETKIPEIFFYKAKNEKELLIAKDFFVLFKNYKIYYYEKCENLDFEDINSYIKKSFFIKDIKTSYFDELVLNKKCDYEFVHLLKPKLFKLFFLYILVLTFSFYFYETQNKKQNFLEFTKELEISKKHLEYNYLENDLVLIQKKAKLHEIELISTEYKNNSFFLIFSSLNHKRLEEFLKEFNSYKLEKMKNNKTTNSLLCHAYVKFNRR